MREKLNLENLNRMKIAILGHGVEGQNLAALFKAHHIEDVHIFEEAKTSHSAVYPLHLSCKFSDIDLSSFDIVFRSPGVSPYQHKLKHPHISSLTQLWLDLHPKVKCICVTGTKGKSTTSSLIAHGLAKLGRSVAVAGNIGTPLFEIEDTQKLDYLIIELSSYQLQGLHIAPFRAVLLNVHPEHISWHESFAQYKDDKLNLIANMPEDGMIIAHPEHNNLHAEYLNGTIYPCDIPTHRENIEAAIKLIVSLGYTKKEALASIQDFTALPHRQEELGRIAQNVLCVDDSLSTIPESCLAALRRYHNKKINLLLGGADRGLNWAAFARELAKKVSSLFCFSETGEKIFKELQSVDHEIENVVFCASLEEAVQKAKKSAAPDSLILFSPAAPSAPPFKNYKERSAVFREILFDEDGHC